MLCVKRDRLNLKDKSFILASCEFIFVDMKFYTHSYKNTLLFYFIILFCYFSKHFQRMRHVLKKKKLYIRFALQPNSSWKRSQQSHFMHDHYGS